VVLPERLDPALLDLLTGQRLPVVLVIHTNHPQEIDASVAGALAPLRAAGVTLLNQTVLLRDINDNAATLTALSEQLFAAGVLPYYLHLLDRVAGAAHFEVDETTARALMRELQQTLPGYLVPRLVREAAGAASKMLVT
jgi:KamA family protein